MAGFLASGPFAVRSGQRNLSDHILPWRGSVSKNLQDFSGVRVLVVEDEFAILLLLEDMLAELGCQIVGTATRLSDALTLAGKAECDAAVLDVNINGENVGPVAEALDARGIPMVFSTGYGRSGLEPRWRERPVLQKPYRLEEFAAALRVALAPPGRT
jgi:CheY-like chemotaxis protein